MNNNMIIIVTALIVLLICHLYVSYGRRLDRIPPIVTGSENRVRLHLQGGNNPCLLVKFKVKGYHSVFLIDTGFAGAPVLNSSLLKGLKSEDSSYETAFNVATQMKSNNRNNFLSVQEFTKHNKCTEYTSGCTLRLMGIGATQEKSSDMLLCPAIELEHTNGGYADCKKNVELPSSDVFMTNSDMRSPHIMTIDYLIHISPLIIDFDAQVMKYGIGMAELLASQVTFNQCTTEFSGGAFVAVVTVGGVPVRCTVDTGASVTISISNSKREKMISKPLNKRLKQMGINGENICSDIHEADVVFCGTTIKNAVVFVNSNEVEDTDGYIGIGLLKCFNLFILENSLFCKRNSQRPSSIDDYSNVCQDGKC